MRRKRTEKIYAGKKISKIKKGNMKATRKRRGKREEQKRVVNRKVRNIF